MNNMTRELIVAEYLAGGVSYRELAARYGYNHRTIHSWVEQTRRRGVGSEPPVEQKRDESAGAAAGAEVKRLRAELRRAELHNKLLNAMIEIAEEQFEIPIRKKSGARR